MTAFDQDESSNPPPLKWHKYKHGTIKYVLHVPEDSAEVVSLPNQRVQIYKKNILYVYVASESTWSGSYSSWKHLKFRQDFSGNFEAGLYGYFKVVYSYTQKW